jgi:FkbM family methyltransferase
MKRGFAARIGYTALKRGLAPPRLASLERYREQWYLKRLLEKLKITVVLDIGANDGKFAEGLRLMGYAGRIASFEPIPSEIKKLRGRAHGDINWQVFDYALGSDTGTADFNVIEEGGGLFYSSFLRPIAAPAVSTVLQIAVKRLDSVWTEIIRLEDRVFLKTDTQGFDMRVLQGAGEYLTNVLGVMTEANVKRLYEGAPHYLETLAFLEAQGFSLMELRVIDRTEQGSVLEYDCILARI